MSSSFATLAWKPVEKNAFLHDRRPVRSPWLSWSRARRRLDGSLLFDIPLYIFANHRALKRRRRGHPHVGGVARKKLLRFGSLVPGVAPAKLECFLFAPAVNPRIDALRAYATWQHKTVLRGSGLYTRACTKSLTFSNEQTGRRESAMFATVSTHR